MQKNFLDLHGLQLAMQKMFELINSFKHTHKNKTILDNTTASYTSTEKTKLSGIQSGAEVNVQADWNETDATSDDYIKNKPTSMKANGGNADTVNGYTVGTNVPADAKFTDTIYKHPTGDGNLHVPAVGTANNGKVLKAGATAGSITWSTLTKGNVGLGNVDNTSDINKPISVSQQAALDSKVDKVTGKELSSNDFTDEEKTKLAGIAVGANKYIHPATHSATMITQDSTHRFVSDAEKSIWNDKYTQNEIDNKLSTLETNIDWKESVDTYTDIATTYPNPMDGWTVNVKDTNYTYRYDGTNWTAISANSIPKATSSVDGLLSKEDKVKIDDTNAKKHTHSNKSILDGITSALISAWDSAVTHSKATHARTDATKTEKSTINGNVKINGVETQVYKLPSNVTFGDGSGATILQNGSNYQQKIEILDNSTSGDGVFKFSQSSDNGATFKQLFEIRDDATGFLGSGKIYTSVNKPSKSDVGLGSVENKSSATIRSELTKENVTTALGYTPPTTNTTYGVATQTTNGLESAADKKKLDGIATGAEVNQNAFTNVKVGTTTISADAKTDTLEFVAGANVTLTPDATNDKITISSVDTKYTHPTHTAKSSGLYKITVDGNGHVSNATPVIKSDITALGIPSTDTNINTTYQLKKDGASIVLVGSDGSETSVIDNDTNTIYTHPTSSGYKHIPSGGSSGQILKWSADGVAVWANDPVDSILSSTSINPVQNKVINAALNGKANSSHPHTIGNITNLQTELNAKAVIKTLTNEDLDAVVVPGFYNGGGGNSCSNKPSGIDAFGLEVIHTASGNYYTQIIHKHDADLSLRRTCINGAWSEWLENKLTDTKYGAAGTSLGLIKSGGDVTISNGVITVNDDSHAHVIANIDGLQTALDSKSANTHTHKYAGSSSVGGAATSANKLSASRKIALTGDVTGTVTSDLSTDISISTVVSNDSHTHGNSTITSLDASKLTGTIDIARLPQGALERCVIVQSDTERFALTKNDIQKGDTVKVLTPQETMYLVIDDTKLSSAEGYTSYSASNALTVPWSGVTGRPSSMKNPTALTIQFNGTTNKTYDGATAQTINITPAAIGAATASHGTHVSYSTTNPLMNGTSAVGSATTVSRSDHVHPTDTSRAAANHSHNGLNKTPNSTTVAYITGTSSSSSNSNGEIFDTGVYLTDTPGRLRVESIEIGGAILYFDTEASGLRVKFK